MTRPPYVRRATAVLVFMVAVAMEFRPVTTDRIPVAATAMQAGEEITEADVRWLDVEPGLEPVRFPAILARGVAPGAVITNADLDPTTSRVPEDWLSLELDVPENASIGERIVAVLRPEISERPVSGVVVDSPSTDDFDGVAALVAFPPSDAVLVARSLAEGDVTVLLGR